MNRFEDNELDLGPDAEAGEREALIVLADRLERERPIPASGFRGELRRRLLSGIGAQRQRPRNLRALVAAYASSGVILLAIAALGVGGVGPLAAG